MKTDILEYNEEEEVEIIQLEPEYGEKNKKWISPKLYQAYVQSRWIVKALNEGGYNYTEVDLIDLLKFVKIKMPDLWNSI